MDQTETDFYDLSPYTVATFRALAEAVVPAEPPMEGMSNEQAAGAAEREIHMYMIWELDHSLSLHSGLGLTPFPLSNPTAQLLNQAAAQFLTSGKGQHSQPVTLSDVPFASLSPNDRIRTLSHLENLEVDLAYFPLPYRNDGGLVQFIVDYLNRGIMFGHYSEWAAYGSTRLRPPAERKLEYFPISWIQAGYPGVAKGYRALRGFLLTIEHKEGE